MVSIWQECVKRGVMCVVTGPDDKLLFHTDPGKLGDGLLRQMGLMRWDYGMEDEFMKEALGDD